MTDHESFDRLKLEIEAARMRVRAAQGELDEACCRLADSLLVSTHVEEVCDGPHQGGLE